MKAHTLAASASFILLAWPLGQGQLSATELPVPKISEVTRVDRDTRPGRADAETATYILKTSPHATLGDAYVIVTDQTGKAFLGPLERLASFRHGSVIHVENLDLLRTDTVERNQLISDLRRTQPRFVAIAPKRQSFTPNMLLGVWSVLAALSDDERLPVFPGLLAAPTQAALSSLVDRSINYHPLSIDQVRPFVMGQVLGPKPFGQRSLQKVRMMRNLFADYGRATHSLIILTDSAVRLDVRVAPAADQWQVAMGGPSRFVEAIPAAAQPALNNASLLILYGHGSPGTECSLDVGAFHHVRMTGKIVMSGDCYSAAPTANEESFAMMAVENGAIVFYGHMHENYGFPHLFPVLEAWMDGLTVGEAYQRQINALIAYAGISPRKLISDESGTAGISGANELLYAIIGDPALQPLAKMTPATL
jgi:hypothetical protein